MKIQTSRAAWRKSIKSEGAYSKSEYSRRITVHAQTLTKYLQQFHRWLAIWISRSDGNRQLAESIFGTDRLEAVLCGDNLPRVSEVFSMAHAIDLANDFRQYFLGKTHLSYELAPNKPSPRARERSRGDGPYYSKLGEFVYIILAEYIVLHNYQFVSGLKANGVDSIDKWLKTIR